jgi:quercetin dioxygenase-like cupin family protein
MRKTRLSERKLPVVSVVPSNLIEVEKLEALIKASPQIDMKPNHYAAKDVFVRQITFPKGCVAVGRVHKYDHISILISGKMQIWTAEKGVHIVEGPSITVARAGMKRAGIALTDTIWATAHGAIGITADSEIYDDKVFDFFTLATMDEYFAFISDNSLEPPAAFVSATPKICLTGAVSGATAGSAGDGDTVGMAASDVRPGI